MEIISHDNFKLAEKGNPFALHQMGIYYKNLICSSNDTLNLNMAIFCFEKADFSESYEELGHLFMQNIYVKQDVDKAIDYYLKSDIDFSTIVSQKMSAKQLLYIANALLNK